MKHALVASTPCNPSMDRIASETAWLKRSLRGLGCPPSDIDDLVQETLLRALRAVGGFVGTDHRGWLYVIARNLLNQQRNAMRLHRRLESEHWQIASNVYVCQPQAVERILIAEMVARIRRLPALSAICLAAVVLGERISDIAARFCMSEDSVRCHVYRARRALRLPKPPAKKSGGCEL